jgi:hypothetical protein
MCPYCGVHQDIREFIVHSSVAYVVGSECEQDRDDNAQL